jgi:hypothetical protein
VPAASTAKTQKTCSKQCRLRRRARQERERRTAELEDARQDERERQRRHRQRVRQALATQAGSSALPLSLAGLSSQLLESIEQIVETVGQAQRVSLAGLCRRIRRIAVKTLGEMERCGEYFGT